MELRDPAKEEIPEKKCNTSQKLSLGYLHMAVRQKTGMKTRAGSDPKEQQGHLGYGADSGPEIATRNRYTHTHTQRRDPFTRGSYPTHGVRSSAGGHPSSTHMQGEPLKTSGLSPISPPRTGSSPQPEGTPV